MLGEMWNTARCPRVANRMKQRQRRENRRQYPHWIQADPLAAFALERFFLYFFSTIFSSLVALSARAREQTAPRQKPTQHFPSPVARISSMVSSSCWNLYTAYAIIVPRDKRRLSKWGLTDNILGLKLIRKFCENMRGKFHLPKAASIFTAEAIPLDTKQQYSIVHHFYRLHERDQSNRNHK